jgi:hypothetical protein
MSNESWFGSGARIPTTQEATGEGKRAFAECRSTAKIRSSTAPLTNPLDNDSCSIAAFARLVGSLASLFVELLASSLALGADVFPGAGCAHLRIIVGGVLSEWIFGLHSMRPVLHRRNGGRRTLAAPFIGDALNRRVAPSQSHILAYPAIAHLYQSHDRHFDEVATMTYVCVIAHMQYSVYKR